MTRTDDRADGGSAGRLLVLLLLSVATAGCSERLTSLNWPLNSNRIPSEYRASNRTRAATLAEVASPEALETPRVRAPGRRSPEPPPGPGGPDTNPDGFFVGLALSGGRPPRANFSAPCIFQLERLRPLQR